MSQVQAPCGSGTSSKAGSRMIAADPSVIARDAILSLPPLTIALTTAWIEPEAIIISAGRVAVMTPL